MRVSKKNISSFIHDIKPPSQKFRRRGSNLPPAFYKPEPSRCQKKPSRKRWRIALLVLIFLAIISVFGASSLVKAKNLIADAAHSGISQFKGAMEDLRIFKPQEAQEKLQNTSQNLNEISSILNQPGISQLNDVSQNFIPFFKSVGIAFQDFQKITALALDLNGKIIELIDQTPNYLLKDGGDKLISALTDINGDLDQINQSQAEMVSLSKDLGNLPIDPNSIINWRLDLTRLSQFTKNLADWLKGSEHHLLILFQNNSEMRPAGGFLGSYADVTISGGSIKKIDVRDIYDPDGQLALKTIPPQPLQAITTNWGARDANWFPDFSQSAEKVIYFLEQSKMYSEKMEKFDGAIALSPKVFEDILSLTGPIKLEDYNLAIDQNNFLTEIQKEVESGADKKQNQPKKILQKLEPMLLDSLSKLNDDQKAKFFDMAQDWAQKKDLMIYFEKPELQSFFDYYGMSGKTFSFPIHFIGDYLSVVNANIAGGKTDIFMKQNILLQSQVNLDGTVDDHLEITRLHNGGKEKYWWYKTANQDYIQVYTSPTSKLLLASGGFAKKINTPTNYLFGGYQTDPDISKIEATAEHFLEMPGMEFFENSDKNVFAAWLKANPGETEKLTLDWRNQTSVLTEGSVYQFVFEKQAGSLSGYDFQISAPLGYEWVEIKSPLFEYQTGDPAGRLTINLTLKKI